MATANYYLDTRRIKKDGTYPIKINVQHKGHFLISTEFTSSKEGWNGIEYSRKEVNYKTKNARLRALMGELEEILLMLEKSGDIKTLTDSALKETIKKRLFKKDDEKFFVDYIDEFVGTKTKENTKAVYINTRNKILAYDPHCIFETIDKRWLLGFEQWMIRSGMKINGISIHLRNIRAVFNYCIDEEYTNLYPFRKFTIKKEQTRKRSLTAEQLSHLRDYPCESHQAKYRDMFMLMFYLIGINAADLFNAKKKDVVKDRLEYQRAKTGRLYSLKIEPEAFAIIERYAGHGEYLLDIRDSYSNYKDFLHRMNLNLRMIGDTERKGRGGKKIRQPLFPDISSYWSRHTWATIAASLDIPKETISAALGHELGSRVTSIYIDFDQRKVDEANRKVIDYVNSLTISTT